MVMVGGENEHVVRNNNSNAQIIISRRSDSNDEEGAASFLERTGHRMPSIDGIEFVDYVDERQLEDVMRLVGQDLSEPYSVFTYRYFLHRWPKLCILAVPTTSTTHDGDDNESNNIDGNIRNKEECQVRRPIGCVVCKIDIEGGDDQDDGDDFVGQVSSNDDACILNGNHEEHGINKMNDGGDGGEELTVRQRTRTGYIGMLAVENTHRRSGIGSALVQRAIHRMQQLGCQSIRLETEVTNKAAISLYENRLGFLREELLKKYYLNWGDAYRLRLWLDG